MHGLRASGSLPKSYDHLDLASNGFFEKNLDNLSQFMDELQNEVSSAVHVSSVVAFDDEIPLH